MKKYFLPPIVRLFSRKWFFIFLNFMSIFFSLSGIRYMIHEILYRYSGMEANGMIVLNNQFKSIAFVLLSTGIIMNSRRTILRLNGTVMDKLQISYCEMSENHGFGIVISGLFISIIIMIIELPDFLFKSWGREAFLYSIALIMVLASVIISIDLIIAYIRTYFRNQGRNQP
jgi:hypothetical protein